MPEKRIGQLWFYDKALNFIADKQERMRNQQQSLLRTLERTGQDGKNLAAVLLSKKFDSAFIPEDFSHIALPAISAYGMYSQNVAASGLAMENMKKARPILIGPATLDSLINNEPEDYGYIINEQLPFKNMFFEFIEPVKLKMPFDRGENDLAGIHFNAMHELTDESFADNHNYLLELYYTTKKGAIKRIIISCDPATKCSFRGSVQGIRFYADMGSKSVKYTTLEDISEELAKGNIVGPDFTSDYRNSGPLSEIDRGNFFINVANLCTNIINYINAENKETVEMRRQVTVKTGNNGGKVRRETREEPYYIIKITAPREYTKEYTHTGMTWQLDERICVIGHNRRLRDENGEIRKVIWIDPCVKGPANAPWKNARYELMGEMIKRERKMMKEGRI